ncbi:17beta-estradiol 17-dehydrogenase / very-long-chain 3-oxoacyl-CoA reductase [Nematocida major]|uniref:17beta-estradiol 17-dehydrogenase / very-long-chain 3-oxoacyl-CoA reductase n=1 Tax=Nematocida major TaxID=1912982 RepID=UPI0020085C3F|nr:17beta-estradiol 17-dehydrogenase / very-long-chain 3-oxoacyl-CoA reductase [Nematocida major]KAH9385728.1 17beta-estradiol 17-dehydrogenase / very-long-chain 3-oxoacyl-CoA reductase [Nematocida major]
MFVVCALGWAATLLLGNALVVLAVEICCTAVRRIRNGLILGRMRGKWAVVTGCTDGIGLSMARELARCKVNLILVSRSPEKLEALRQDLSKEVEAKVIPIDFEQEVDFRSALEPARECSPCLLVNNVGVNEAGPTAFAEHTEKSIHRILQVNIVNTIGITKEFLAWGASPAGKRYILSTGSMLGIMPSPFQQVYAGSKAFLQAWMDSVASEPTDCHCEVLMTGLVCSKLSGAKKPNLFTPSAELYGQNCIHSFGTGHVTYPYFPHFILSMFLRVLPGSLVGAAMRRVGEAVRAMKRRKSEAAAKKKE